MFFVLFLFLLSFSVVLESLGRKVAGKQGDAAYSIQTPQGLCIAIQHERQAPGCCGWGLAPTPYYRTRCLCRPHNTPQPGVSSEQRRRKSGWVPFPL